MNGRADGGDICDGIASGGIKYVHMLGVNGISMSGLAEILLERGLRVSGSDLASSEKTESLARRGAVIYTGNSASNIKEGDLPDLLVYTAAAGPDNPERARAAELGVACVERAALLGWIMAGHGLSIGVSGTHGKTTTSAMIASILLAAGLDPTTNIGGDYAPAGGNTRIGGKGVFLAEACEYTDTFLKLYPSIAVVTNIEYDHSDYFKDIDQLRASFARFAAQAGRAVVANADDGNVRMVLAGDGKAPAAPLAGGAVVANADDGNVRMVLAGDDKAPAAPLAGSATVPAAPLAGGATVPAAPLSVSPVKRIYFGVESPAADYRAADIEYDGRYNGSFALVSKDSGELCRIALRVPGLYNIYNALAAAAASMAAGCPIDAVVAGLEGFAGVKKRFEYKGSVNGFDIIDDYAHHPSEVASALKSARNYVAGGNGTGRVYCAFQPHTYSRTKTFLHEFAEAFTAADRVLLADIFPAREKDPGDISSAILADEINKTGGDAAYFPGGFRDIAAYIMETAKPGDLALTMGAGLAAQVADILLSRA